MEIKRRVAAVFWGVAVSFAVIPAVAAAEQVGEVIYREGQPSVIRGGRQLEDQISAGFRLYNLDHVRNDSLSLLQFNLNAVSGTAGSVTVQPASELYLAFDNARQKAVVHLLRGSSSVVVERLQRGQSLQVHAADAVLEVRGTSFSIDTSVQGEYLVATVSGRVDVQNASGDVITALPGRAVEYTVTNGFRSIPLRQGDEEVGRAVWREQRHAVLMSQADAVMSNLARRYLVARDEFLELYSDLVEQQEIIDRWIEEDRQGTRSSMAEQMQQKTALSDPLTRVASHSLLFEPLYYRVAALRELLGDEEYSGNEFDRDAKYVQKRLDMLRYITRLYADRNDGQLPL